MANQEHGADDALVEAVARAIAPAIEADGEIYWAQEYGRPLPTESAQNIARAAITAYRQQERPAPERLAVEPVGVVTSYRSMKLIGTFSINPHTNGHMPIDVGTPLYTAEALATARAEEREACARVCEDQLKTFASPEYATGQPMVSFSERFACRQCAAAIRARSSEDNHNGR
jgi:hypothetical protein